MEPSTTLTTLPNGKIKHPRQLVTDAPRIRGIAGLAYFLKCSTSSAQKLKDSGAIPYFQVGKMIFFNEEQVLAAIDNPKTSAQ